MGALILHILFVAAGAVIGAAAGWLLRGDTAVPRIPEPQSDAPATNNPQLKAQELDKSFDHVEAVMSRLHQLTASVAADVGVHSSRVQAINEELTSGADVVSVVERLMKVNEQMQTQLQAAEQRMQQQAKEIESHVKEARTDALTKLANRRAFDDEIRHCVDALQTKGQPSCVMMIDVDHFKKFNDTYGHQAGDEVLRSVGRVLRRESTGKEIVCRYGGEEFAVIYPGMDSASAILRAEKARGAIAREIVEFQGMDLKVTASGGVAELRPNEDGETLVKRADDALYVCKEKGRNCGYFHDGKSAQPMKDVVRSPRPSEALERKERPSAEAPTTESVFKLTEETESQRAQRRDRPTNLSEFESFCQDIDRRIAEHRRQETPLNLLLISVDNARDLADAYGTKAVELAIRTVAQIIRATKREMDHGARCKDNLFGVLLPGATVIEAGAMAERIRVAVESCLLPVYGEEFHFTVSMGLTAFQRDDERERLLARASHSLEAASNEGGNRLVVADSEGQLRPMTFLTSDRLK